MRSFRFLILASLLALFALPSHAQDGSTYGMFNYTHIALGDTSSTNSLGFVTTTAASSYNAYGVTFGGTFNFVDSEKHTIGIDLRETIDPSSNHSAYMTLASARFGFVNAHSRLMPYIQAGGGFLMTAVDAITQAPPPAILTAKTTATTTHGAFGGFAGIDYAINSTLSYRVEAGGGGLSGGGSFVGLNTGLVFNF